MTFNQFFYETRHTHCILAAFMHSGGCESVVFCDICPSFRNAFIHGCVLWSNIVLYNASVLLSHSAKYPFVQFLRHFHLLLHSQFPVSDIYFPCRCLCLGFSEQMIYTCPLPVFPPFLKTACKAHVSFCSFRILIQSSPS